MQQGFQTSVVGKSFEHPDQQPEKYRENASENENTVDM